MIADALFSSRSEEWGTPQSLFDSLNQEFHFTVDVCASDANHKCVRYYTKAHDGLSKQWKGEIAFCNPPYGRKIANWVKKAYEETKYHDGTTVVLLIPARTDTKYFHDFIYNHHETRFIKGRLKFTDEHGMEENSAPFPSMVVVMK